MPTDRTRALKLLPTSMVAALASSGAGAFRKGPRAQPVRRIGRLVDAWVPKYGSATGAWSSACHKVSTFSPIHRGGGALVDARSVDGTTMWPPGLRDDRHVTQQRAAFDQTFYYATARRHITLTDSA